MKSFKIAAPFVKIDEIELLKEAGVNELYCGYVDKEFQELWPVGFTTINRRGKGQSFEDFVSFKIAVEKAHKYQLPVYVTMNGLYTPEQYPGLLKIIKKVSRLEGVKGLIVADIGLFLTLRKIDFKKEIHVSTGGTTFNYLTADFFSSLGASRIILDRQLIPKEMADLISQRTTNIGIEIFIMKDPCLFIDGYCVLSHYLDMPEEISRKSGNINSIKSYNTTISRFGCEEIKDLLSQNKFKVYSILSKRKDSSFFRYQADKYSLHCNLCSLYDLRNFPDITLKVSGRGDNNFESIRMVLLSLQILKHKNISKREYQGKVRKLYFDFLKKDCNGFKCYCPESLIKIS